MSNTNPTPSQLLAALIKHGVKVKTYKGWDSVGRPWRGPDGSPGLTGSVVHHTSTASATGSKGTPSLGWAVTAYDLPVCNMLIGRDEVWLLSAGSAYHCGDGGPVPELGVPSRGFLGQTRFFGIELDDPGVKTDSLTAFQVDQCARTLAALAELAGWDLNKAVGTHKCYTDGCHGWNRRGPSATVGRKNDTIDGAWREFPGSDKPKPYNAPFWRAAAKAAGVTDLWDGTVPARAAVVKSADEGVANKAAWRLACRLHDLGFKDDVAPVGKQQYPTNAVARFREAKGLGRAGTYSQRTEQALFGKSK